MAHGPGPATPAASLGADAWARLPDLPQPVVSGCAARLGNAIYLTGGGNRGGALDTVYRLDLSDRTWESLDDPLPQPRRYHACTVVDGRLYLIGGAVGGDWLTQPATWSYDPQAAAGERWTIDLAPPPGGGMEGSAVAVGDAIYFLGSYELADHPASRTSQPTVVRYDPVDDDWQALPDLQAGTWRGRSRERRVPPQPTVGRLQPTSSSLAVLIWRTSGHHAPTRVRPRCPR